MSINIYSPISPCQEFTGSVINEKMKLLITDKIDNSFLTPLNKIYEISIKLGLSPQQLENIIGDYNCIITRSATSITDKILSRGVKLKIIARAGIGVDNIDIFSATRRKIAVVNAPIGNARATAEHTIGLILALLRHIPQANLDLKNGIWNKSKYVGFQLKDKTLGIVGYGNVGKEVYRMAKGIGMNVVVCEPYIKLPSSLRHLTYEELLNESDVITFHVPSTYLTRNMLNKNTLSLTKKGVFLINCSRGQVIDEKAIIDGLQKGHLAGLALDVFTKEPPLDQTLLKFPNVIATPHIAGSTHESQKESVKEVVSAILSLNRNIPPANLLNPQVFSKVKSDKKILEFDSIIFDCDSTLTEIEGIDELAALYGKKRQISRLTKLAMEGLGDFEKIYHQRLKILSPSRQNLQKLGNLYWERLTKDALETVNALKFLGKNIYIISGSFTPALLILAGKLDIPSKNIFANDLLFDHKGLYQRPIEGPLKRNYGKLQIVRQIKGRKIFFGDGITDMETKNLVDLFVGFGGIAVRPQVEEKSDIYLYNKSFAPALVLSAGITGSTKLLKTKYSKLVGKGIDLLTHSKHTRINKAKLPIFMQIKQMAYL